MPADPHAEIELAKFEEQDGSGTGFFAQWDEIPPKERAQLNKVAEQTLAPIVAKEEKLAALLFLNSLKHGGEVILPVY